MAVGPGDVHAGPGGDVNLHGGGLFARVERDGHRKIIAEIRSQKAEIRTRKDRFLRSVPHRSRDGT
jgi:hypothetical protein